MQKKSRHRRPGQQIEFEVDGLRVVASIWMYRGTWVAETTVKGGRYFQQIGQSDLEAIQRLESAVRRQGAARTGPVGGQGGRRSGGQGQAKGGAEPRAKAPHNSARQASDEDRAD